VVLDEIGNNLGEPKQTSLVITFLFHCKYQFQRISLCFKSGATATSLMFCFSKSCIIFGIEVDVDPLDA
jgi:hypothetical protein